MSSISFNFHRKMSVFKVYLCKKLYFNLKKEKCPSNKIKFFFDILICNSGEESFLVCGFLCLIYLFNWRKIGLESWDWENSRRTSLTCVLFEFVSSINFLWPSSSSTSIRYIRFTTYLHFIYISHCIVAFSQRDEAKLFV